MRETFEDIVRRLENNDFLALPAASIFEKIDKIDPDLLDRVFIYAEEMQRKRQSFAQSLEQHLPPTRQSLLKRAFTTAVTAAALLYFIVREEFVPRRLAETEPPKTQDAGPDSSQRTSPLRNSRSLMAQNDGFLFDENTMADDLRRSLQRVISESLIPSDKFDELEQMSLKIAP